MRWPGGHAKNLSDPDVLAAEIHRLDTDASLVPSAGPGLQPWGTVQVLAPAYADWVESGYYHAPRSTDTEAMCAITQLLLRLAVRAYSKRFRQRLRRLGERCGWSGWNRNGIVHWTEYAGTGWRAHNKTRRRMHDVEHHYACVFCRKSLATLGHVGATIPTATWRPWELHTIPCGLRGLDAQESWNAPETGRVTQGTRHL